MLFFSSTLYENTDPNFTLGIFNTNTFTVSYDSVLDCSVKCTMYEKTGNYTSPISDVPLYKEIILNKEKITPFLEDNSEINIVNYNNNEDYFTINGTVIFNIEVTNNIETVEKEYEYKLTVPNIINSIIYNGTTLTNQNNYLYRLVGDTNTYPVKCELKNNNYVTVAFNAYDFPDTPTNAGYYVLLENALEGDLDYTMLFIMKRNWNANNSGYGLIYKQSLIIYGIITYKICILYGAYYKKPEDL